MKEGMSPPCRSILFMLSCLLMGWGGPGARAQEEEL
jgi:hypothetical protein